MSQKNDKISPQKNTQQEKFFFFFKATLNFSSISKPKKKDFFFLTWLLFPHKKTPKLNCINKNHTSIWRPCNGSSESWSDCSTPHTAAASAPSSSLHRLYSRQDHKRKMLLRNTLARPSQPPRPRAAPASAPPPASPPQRPISGGPQAREGGRRRGPGKGAAASSSISLF